MIIDDDTQQLRCSAGRSSVVFFRAWTRTDVERERYGSDGRAVILSATDPLPHARHTQLDSPWGPVTRRCGRFLFASNRSHRRSTSPIKMHRAPQETERNAYRPEESIQPPRSLSFSFRIAKHGNVLIRELENCLRTVWRMIVFTRWISIFFFIFIKLISSDEYSKRRIASNILFYILRLNLSIFCVKRYVIHLI